MGDQALRPTVAANAALHLHILNLNNYLISKHPKLYKLYGIAEPESQFVVRFFLCNSLRVYWSQLI